MMMRVIFFVFWAEAWVQPLALRAARRLAAEIESMSTREVLSELRDRGVATRGLFERDALADRLASARREANVREAVEFSRRRPFANRDEAVARTATLGDDEIRAVLLGRGVREASDPNVPTALFAELLAELRLGETEEPLEEKKEELRPVDHLWLRAVADRVVEGLGRGLDVAKEVAKERVPRLEKKPRVVPFALNRLFDAALQVASWASAGRLEPRAVAAAALLLAFTKHGLLASFAFILLLRLLTDLLTPKLA